MTSKTENLLSSLRGVPVVPVVTIEDARQSIPLARTLVEAGLPVLEVTLRTPAALDAIAAIAKAVPEAIVAAGTVTRASQAAEAADAGAKFIVTPGTPPRLAEALVAAPIPVMPGCATPSEAMALAELGYGILKLFPAAASGGVAWLKAIYGPLPHLAFCPTGGIDRSNAPMYLALPNVVCIGGSWITPAPAIASGDFGMIAQLAQEASGLCGHG